MYVATSIGGVFCFFFVQRSGRAGVLRLLHLPVSHHGDGRRRRRSAGSTPHLVTDAAELGPPCSRRGGRASTNRPSCGRERSSPRRLLRAAARFRPRTHAGGPAGDGWTRGAAMSRTNRSTCLPPRPRGGRSGIKAMSRSRSPPPTGAPGLGPPEQSERSPARQSPPRPQSRTRIRADGTGHRVVGEWLIAASTSCADARLRARGSAAVARSPRPKRGCARCTGISERACVEVLVLPHVTGRTLPRLARNSFGSRLAGAAPARSWRRASVPGEAVIHCFSLMACSVRWRGENAADGRCLSPNSRLLGSTRSNRMLTRS